VKLFKLPRFPGEAPLVYPSYNHASDEREFMAVVGVACLLGAALIVILALLFA
jgi:hypothetical protein